MRFVAMMVVAAGLVLSGCSSTLKTVEMADSQVLGASASHDRWKETVPGADRFGRTMASFRRMLTAVEGEVALRNAAMLCPELAQSLLDPENFGHLAEVHWEPAARSLTGYAEFKGGSRYVIVPPSLRPEAKQLTRSDRVEVRLPSKRCGGLMEVTGVPVKAS